MIFTSSSGLREAIHCHVGNVRQLSEAAREDIANGGSEKRLKRERLIASAERASLI